MFFEAANYSSVAATGGWNIIKPEVFVYHVPPEVAESLAHIYRASSGAWLQVTWLAPD